MSDASIETPCVAVCMVMPNTGETTDPMTDLCMGCARSREQIMRWRSYSDAERSAIMETLEPKLTALREELRARAKAKTRAVSETASQPKE